MGAPVPRAGGLEVVLAGEMRNSGSHIHDVQSGSSCRGGVSRVPWPRDGTPLGVTSVEVFKTQRWIRLDDGQRGHSHSAISCANGLEGRGPSPWLPHTYDFCWTCSSAPSLRSQHAEARRNNSTQKRFCSSPARAGRQELHPEWVPGPAHLRATRTRAGRHCGSPSLRRRLDQTRNA